MMKTRTKILLVLIATLIFLSNCSENENINLEKYNDQPISVEYFPAKYDSISKTYSVTNFYDYDFTWVTEFPHPSAESKAGRTAYVTPSGEIKQTEEVHINLNGGAFPSSLEVYGNANHGGLPDHGFVLTGIGAWIQSSTYNYRSLLLEFRELRSDGTLGPRYRIFAPGSDTYVCNECETGYQLEAWYAVPEGCVIWGIGWKGKYDVQNLSVYFRYLTVEQGQITLLPSIYKGVSGIWADGVDQIEYRPYYTPDLRWNFCALQGVGLTSNSGGTTVMKVDVGYFKTH